MNYLLSRNTGIAAVVGTALVFSLNADAGSLNKGGGADEGAARYVPRHVIVRSITVFGDSLSDVGTYHPATGDPANPGKFTVNPGKIWVENIATAYGLTLSPNRALTLDKDASFGATTQVGLASVIGGNGYAEGGARVTMRPSESGVGNNKLVAPVSEQVSRYLATNGRFKPHELIIIDGGGNDIYAQFSAVCWHTDDNGIGPGNTTLDVAAAAVEKAANEQVQLVRQILSNGAKVLVVAAAGDWSSSPFGQKYLSPEYQIQGCYTPVTAAQVTAWTQRFNQILSSAVAGLPGVVYVNVSAVLGDAALHPNRYGFVNVTDRGCTNTTPTTSAAFCTDSTLVSPNAAQTYFWSDDFHPTPRGHQILSDQVLRQLRPLAKKFEE